MSLNIVVEFVGAPAAGKTTLSKAVADRLSETVDYVWEPTRAIGTQTRSQRVGNKVRYVTEYAFCAPITSFGMVQKMSQTAQQNHSDTIRVSFNWLYVCGLSRCTGDELTLLDQGVFQALWSIGYSSELDWKRALRALTVPSSVLPDFLVVVTADEATLTDRLGADHRSETRVAESEMSDIRRAIAGVEALQDLLDEYASAMRGDGYIVVDNSEGADFDETVSEVVSTIQALADEQVTE